MLWRRSRLTVLLSHTIEVREAAMAGGHVLDPWRNDGPTARVFCRACGQWVELGVDDSLDLSERGMLDEYCSAAAAVGRGLSA